MLKRVFKKGIIDDIEINYSNMIELKNKVTIIKQSILEVYSYNHIFNTRREISIEVIKPKEPVFWDFYVCSIFKRNKNNHICTYCKDRPDKVRKYMKIYDIFIDNLEEYINTSISKGNISYMLLLDIEKVIDYKIKYGYSLSSYYKLNKALLEIKEALLDF